MQVTKRNNQLEPFKRQKLEKILFNAASGLSGVNTEVILTDIELQLFERISTKDIHKGLISTTLQHVQTEPGYSDLASRLLLFDIYKQSLGKFSFDDLNKAYRDVFPAYIRNAIEKKLLSPVLLEHFDLQELANALDHTNDNLFKFNGLFTLSDRYLIRDFKDNERILEAPQFFWMRVAMGVALNEKNPTEWAIKFYKKMSKLEYVAATPTLFNSGTLYPQLSSCFVLDLPDSIEGIADGIKDTMFLEKHSGGIGMNVTRLRAAESVINSIQGKSSGPIPFLKMFDSVVAGVSQGGRRRGSMAIYAEPWHLNIEDFIRLKGRTGDETQRLRVLNTVIWANDEFFKRVKSDQPWYLFDPNEVSDLPDLYGDEFAKRYHEYIHLAQNGELQNYRVVKAKDLFNKILTALIETAHPWITFKDAANRDCPINHKMLVHSTNLCTEIFLPTNPKTTAVCNLTSLNLARHLNETKSDFDYDKLRESVRTSVRQLDNVIDVNYYPTEKAKKGNQEYRPVGLGVMGFADALEQLQVPYGSEIAEQLTDRIFKLMKEEAVKTSSELAQERGTFPEYKGSGWDKQGIPMRNGTVMAVAPTVTISMIAGTSQSLDPNYSNFFTRNNIAGKFAEFNVNLVDVLKSLNLWERLNQDILLASGSVQNIKEIPDHIKEVYKTAYELDQKQVIKVAAIAQKHIDQGISRNLYFDTKNLEELSNVYMYAWEMGLKSTYYAFFAPSAKTEGKFLYKQEEEKTLPVSTKEVLAEQVSVQPVQAGTEKQQTVFCSLTPDSPEFEQCEACQ
ncbi:MAG: ribonucleoside-diphosphate reductase subunit alpha [Candidatus Caenarcaniphilales bacterium]|nr:ribonucleoside-diphosphate reductase subunit alpha [Candidatus Caenarcaniphilales bacterium]